MNIEPVVSTEEEEEKQGTPDPGPFVPIRAGAVLVPFPANGEEGKHQPTSNCEQGEVLKLTPPVPCKHHKVRRMAGVFISFLKSWLKKNFVHLKKKKIKV